MNTKPLLVVDKITKKIQKKTILNNCSLEIYPGDFHALVGQNGAGKSSLLKLISGQELLSQGNILYKQTSTQDWEFPYSRELIFISELCEILAPLSIKEFIRNFLSGSPNWNQEYFDYLIRVRSFDLNKNFQTLSRGQKMQFNLMMALANSPQMLLIDEITSVLDIEARYFFLEELKKFCQKGGAVVITSNIITELEGYATGISIIKNQTIEFTSNVCDFEQHFVKLRLPSQNPPSIESIKKLHFTNGERVFMAHRKDIAQIEPYICNSSITLQDITLYFYSENHQEFYEVAA
ncbi:MAG: ATP-binding cassette domain-containing protein [Halobacteriovoraceae bacterium]|nr:ATP-binding cassette domain-containing protein [Halobacteriovoraceae bacterium]